ncbi:hypothetical protein MA16_Dca008468 [Dendrobium catenatum]|uniref:Amidohydrolase-related domain-containing protein n=1 Tax=Dendrobium catenatum TaxID=906689 RepID=A0A2I0XHI5_9ASPA|nr:hypothetical protein MA16_Dca008468 [Dendrobium catenatum]
MAASSAALVSYLFAPKPLFPSPGRKLLLRSSGRRRASTIGMELEPGKPVSQFKAVDSHVHVWASREEASERYPYFPGHEPSLPGDSEILLKCMGEANVDGALIVQPINHMFDHDLVTRALKKHPSKFIGCCLANPAEDGSGILQFEHLVLKEGYRGVRFNPNIWPSGQKGISFHLSEIEELCSKFPSTSVILDHMGFCKPPINDEERKTFSGLLRLSKFPQVYLKFSALFRLSRNSFPYDDTGELLSQAISSYGSNRIMWGRYLIAHLIFSDSFYYD